MITAIAVDDEPFALEVLRAHAAKVSFIKFTAFLSSSVDAINYLAANPVDVLFLDINMPDMTGLEVADSLQIKPLVIFTTAYAEYAVQSYDLNAIDYLLKPFSFARFLKACHKAKEQLNKKQDIPVVTDSIFVKSGYSTVRINFNDILYMESGGNYITFVLENDKRILSRYTISEVLELLPVGLFVRVHRSYIVNKQKISLLERHQVYINGNAIPISSAYPLTVT